MRLVCDWDVHQVLLSASAIASQVFLAADTVYDEELTESFMRCAAKLLRPCPDCSDCAAHCCCHEEPGESMRVGTQLEADQAKDGGSSRLARPRVLLVALEKRYNFTLRDMVCLEPWQLPAL